MTATSPESKGVWKIDSRWGFYSPDDEGICKLNEMTESGRGAICEVVRIDRVLVLAAA